MKNRKIWMGTLLTTGVLISSSAYATKVWTLIPGVLASEIAVGASDHPFVIKATTPGHNGEIYFGRQVCTSGPICAPIEQWVDTNGAGIKIAVNLNNQAWTHTQSGSIWLHNYANGLTSWALQPTFTFPNGSISCLTSFVNTYEQETPEVAFPDVAFGGTGLIEKLWGISCGATPNLMELDVNLFISQGGPSYGSTRWVQIDSQDQQVALFTHTVINTNGSGTVAGQRPWVLWGGTPWAWNGAQIVQQPQPALAFLGQIIHYPVGYLTDGYALSAPPAVVLWRWNGTIDGTHSGGDANAWTLIPTSIPAGVTLVKIAASSALPNVQFGGWVGPSSIWALDTNGNVYRLDDLGDPPR